MPEVLRSRINSGISQKGGKRVFLETRIRLSDNQDLVASLIDNEKLDLRVFVKTNDYTGAIKRGFMFYLFDDNWTEFKKLIEMRWVDSGGAVTRTE